MNLPIVAATRRRKSCKCCTNNSPSRCGPYVVSKWPVRQWSEPNKQHFDVIARCYDLGLPATEHPHAADLGVEVHVHLVLEHHRLVSGQVLQQLPQAPAFSRQNPGRGGPTPAGAGAGRPGRLGVGAAGGWFPDFDSHAVVLPCAEHNRRTAPAAAPAASGAGRRPLADPMNYHASPPCRSQRGRRPRGLPRTASSPPSVKRCFQRANGPAGAKRARW